MAVASFYDMYHLKPVGRHLVEVCTNVSCALVGAQQVLEAFEDELGVHAGETTEDGEVTLRTVECAGGCGWATVVAVDHRYRERLRRADVPAIVEELRVRPELEQFVVLAGAEERRALRSSPTTARPAASRRSRRRATMEPAAGRPGDPRLGPPRPRRRLLPDRPQGELPRAGHRQADLPRRQRGRVGAGHVQGPRDHVHASRTG